ncbi:MAG: ribose 5-phosphate isomerase B [Flavobacteriales bacterium]|nr:ribose 5-phosphate isomerase B [Flavobacteriales bacterium]
MKLYLGSDHAGFELKEEVYDYLKDEGFKVKDLGTKSDESTDYPEYAHKVAESVAEDEDSLGILICGSANGVCMTANKHEMIRAAIAWEPEIAKLAREHNNANVLCLPARFISKKKAKKILDSYLGAEFEGGRHQRRIDKIVIC